MDLKDITILKSESIINDRGELEFKADEIMKQFISYAVGVMFGRYSLDKDGLSSKSRNEDYPKDTKVIWNRWWQCYSSFRRWLF